MDYMYRCKKCGRSFDYKAAGHSIEVISQGKRMLQACRGELEKIELMAEIPLVKSKIMSNEKNKNSS